MLGQYIRMCWDDTYEDRGEAGGEFEVEGFGFGGRAMREAGIVLPNNLRQQGFSHAPKDVLPLRMLANYCAQCQPHLRAFFGWIRSPLPTEGDNSGDIWCVC